ncbi:hypothetical protein B0J14DRAFT_638443 [Halenospora varia]|nr:hypothetical protein B0J14DRAFT_638443 [Halenospora varia]
MAINHAIIPQTLPAPIDDGLTSHLLGSLITPDLTRISTQDEPVKLSALPGAPSETVPGEWNNTPGDKERLGLPYDLLSDENLEFVKGMKMPIFEWEGKPLVKRCTLALIDGTVEHVWYPVFPPNESASEVAAWLKSNRKTEG